MRKWLLVFSLLVLSSRENKKKKFLLASLKTLTNSKSCSESRIKFSVQAFLCSHWSIYFCVHSKPSFGTISESQVGFGTTFKGTGGYQKAGKSFLKRVTGRNFTISK
jgi:hypothetical protein